jgi:hypothetical protein
MTAMRRASVIAILLFASSAQAAPSVDWARGLVIADGIGLADRHAPNPAVARGTSRRAAEDAARKILAAKCADLPLASGGTVGTAAKDAAVKDRLARAVANAVTLSADPETDGSWRVTMAVAVEAVRQAVDGPRVATEDKGPPVVVVEGATAKPAVGWKVGGSAAPTLWVASPPAWAKDAPHVKATSAKAGAIDIDGTDATPATLFVILTKP